MWRVVGLTRLTTFAYTLRYVFEEAPTTQGAKVEALAQHSAAVQQRTGEQLGQVQRQQERLPQQTSEYLQAQYDRQSALLEQQKEMRRQMDENRLYLEELYRLLRAAEQAVGMQGRQLESLAEAVQPHLQALLGAFELGAAPPVEQRPLGSDAVTVADEKDVTETEWENYFLSARIPDNTEYKTLDREVKSLYMGVNLQDAESRLSRLMADFYEILDRLNMEDIVQDEPKKVVGYLIEALRPPAFKSAVKDQLGRQAHKPAKNNIQLFLNSFMRFEEHMAVQHPHHQNSTKSASPPTAGGHLKKLQGGNQYVANMLAVAQDNKITSGIVEKEMTETLLDALDKADSKLKRQDLPKLSAVIGIGDKPVPVRSKVKLDLRFSTPGGPLILQNVICWVTQDFLPAQSLQEIWDMEDADDDRSRSLIIVLAYSGTAQVPEPTAEELQLQEEEDCACFPNFEASDKQDDREVIAVLEEKNKDVYDSGATHEYVDQLLTVLMKYRDVFRVKIGKDPPVDMPPMEITLKPGAVPVKCRARRYSPEHRAFLKNHVQELLEAGLCFWNPWNRWCSPPHIVQKPGVGNFRMTVDVKSANEQVEQVVWPMPILEVEFDRLCGSSRYFSLDFFKSFFQFAVAAQCQEIYSILTEDGVVTPTRVLMGGTNSVTYVQSTVQAMFADVFNNSLLIWIDDLLGYEANDDTLLKLLVRVLEICASKGLRLNLTKCAFYLREALWCGRVVSGEGVKHDPARIEALMSLPPPLSGNELQQVICALNWMRSSLPAYNKFVHPLVLQIEEGYMHAGYVIKIWRRKFC
ncbi:hypothetical protein ON010_g1641 [Phytophthora cinnamomi]|nr:hypothetical protein ON010_g1641 [Phytophthora cinnamomi]